MHIVIRESDFSKLSSATQRELMSRFTDKQPLAIKGPASHVPALAAGSDFADFDMSRVVDLTHYQIEAWMRNVGSKLRDAMMVFAQHGPIIDFKILHQAGIDDLSSLQSRSTIRTRTILRDKERRVRLIGWDEWLWDKKNDCWKSGRYAITPITHQSLRRFFELDD